MLQMFQEVEMLGAACGFRQGKTNGVKQGGHAVRWQSGFAYTPHELHKGPVF